MSKSKGNVIDPLSVMDQYGTDALRFTLASMASPSRDIKLAEERIEGYRNFGNKIWNAARFILMNLDGPRERVQPKDRSFPDRWILSRLNSSILQVNDSLQQYRFDQASYQMYQFIWHEYCDWYLELIKPTLQQKDSLEARRTRQTLIESFETLLRLLHPFMPFISEEIWQTLPKPTGDSQSIMIQRYPTPLPEWDAKDAQIHFSTLERFVTLARTGRNLLNYSPAKNLTLYGVTYNQDEFNRLESLKPYLENLSRGSVQIDLKNDRYDDGLAKDVLRFVAESMTVGLRVEGEVDLQKALQRTVKQLADVTEEIDRLAKKLKNADFVAKAPPEVIEEHRQRVMRANHEQALLQSSQEQLQALIQSRI